ALPPALAGVHGASAPDAAAPALPVHQAALPSHPQSPAFAGDLGAELRWMVEAGLQQAELHLNPAELGPIQVQLSLQSQTAEIHFAAAHATTRDSIQQALPVLREMLAGQGLQLGQAGVSGGDAGREFAQAQAQAQERVARAAAGPAVAAAGAAAPRAAPRAGRGMLDLYA
ncbi:MAG: flagellar hook-length control protein FliK, partial [Comamonadaceae bacterium]